MVKPIKATLREGKIHCPSCQERNARIYDYKTVSINDNVYVKYVSKCNKCGQEFYYFFNVLTEEHFVFDEKEAKEIKESTLE